MLRKYFLNKRMDGTPAQRQNPSGVHCKPKYSSSACRGGDQKFKICNRYSAPHADPSEPMQTPALRPCQGGDRLREGDCSRTLKLGEDRLAGWQAGRLAGRSSQDPRWVRVSGWAGGVREGLLGICQPEPSTTPMGDCPNLSLRSDMSGPENCTCWYHRLRL